MNRRIWRGLTATAICVLAGALAAVVWFEHQPRDPDAAARRVRMQRPEPRAAERGALGESRDWLAEAENAPEDLLASGLSAVVPRPSGSPPEVFLPNVAYPAGQLLGGVWDRKQVRPESDEYNPFIPHPHPPPPPPPHQSRAQLAAISHALRWLAQHQHADGRWSFQLLMGSGKSRSQRFCDCPGRGQLRSDTMATALALLALLPKGTDATHSGLATSDGGVGCYAAAPYGYQKNIDAGVRWLVDNMDEKTGRACGTRENMLAHGMATVAMCRACAADGNESLRRSCRSAVAFIVNAQNQTDGGWGWQPGDVRHMTPTVWQVMALSSAVAAHVPVPSAAVDSASRFVALCETEPYSGRYAPYPHAPPSGDATAMGLFARLLLRGSWRDVTRTRPGWHDLEEATAADDGLSRHGALFAALLCRHLQAWGSVDRFQSALDSRVGRQAPEAHLAGSWSPDPRSREEQYGGRLYATAMYAATLSALSGLLPVVRTGTD